MHALGFRVPAWQSSALGFGPKPEGLALLLLVPSWHLAGSPGMLVGKPGWESVVWEWADPSLYCSASTNLLWLCDLVQATLPLWLSGGGSYRL